MSRCSLLLNVKNSNLTPVIKVVTTIVLALLVTTYVCVCVVNGGWSSWIREPCSKTCGGGMQNLTRECNNPRPLCGGNSCNGDSVQQKRCNDNCCPGKIIQ